jgi:hypothetical protein
MQPSASEAGTAESPTDPGDPDHSKSVPGKGTMNNDDLFATRFDATGTEATGTGPAVPAEDEATTEGDDSTTADDPSALQDVGSVDRKRPKRSDRDTPKGVLTVAVDGKHTMEVKVGRQRLRTIASLKSESFRLPVGMRSVKWRRPGEPTWKTTPVRVKTKCERQLRIPSTTVKTFGTCE